MNGRRMIPMAWLFAMVLSTSQAQNTLSPPQPRDSTVARLTEPYQPLKGKPARKRNPFSPDPLVNVRWENPLCTDELEIYTLKPQSTGCTPSKSATWKRDGAHVVVKNDCDVMFDFGQVNAGWLEFECEDTHGADLQCSISEFNEPAVFNLGSEHPRKTARPKKYGQSYRLELNRQLYEGVRYAWIHLKQMNREVTIKNIRLICQTKPTNYQGSFLSNSEPLNRIWYTAAYTVRLNLMKEYFGAILMERSDRHSWTGDAHTSQAAALVAFGNYDFIRTNIYNTAQQYNGIASYSLYWVLSLIDYYQYSGDIATLDDLTDNVCFKLETAYGHTKKLSSLSFYGWDERLGAGFENPDLSESHLAYRSLSIHTWKKFAQLMEGRGKPQLARKYNAYADEQTARMRCEPDYFRTMGIFAASDAINAGVVTPAEYPMIWKEAFADRLQRVSYSPFNQYFVLTAMGVMNRYAEAMNTIDDCWGGQLRYGATTFFEVFRPSWNFCRMSPNDAPVNNQCGYTSLTHPWSAGVAKWLTEEVVGIRPIEPGFKRFRVRPHLVDSLLAIQGTVPTPHGNIEFRIDTEKGTGSLTVPANTRAELHLPMMGSRITEVVVDGRKTTFSATDSTHATLSELDAGKHAFTFRYASTVQSPIADEALAYRFPSSTVSEDSLTQGDWKGVYGSKGYILFNYDRKGTHRVNLPEECRGFALNRNGNCLYEQSEEDLRSLVSDREGDSSRRLGVIYTQDPQVCMQTMTIDLDHRTRTTYKLSLYLVDWERSGRRSAIEIFDLKQKKILTPVRMVRSYGMGRYVTFELDTPVRIRINHVRGDNAACAALFID